MSSLSSFCILSNSSISVLLAGRTAFLLSCAKPIPEKSAWLYANVSDIKNLVGDELVASAIKSAMAELAPNEVTNCTKIEPLAQQKLAESPAQKYGEDVVVVNKVVINDMNFEDAYNEAIQQRSIAQQNAVMKKIEIDGKSWQVSRTSIDSKGSTYFT